MFEIKDFPELKFRGYIEKINVLDRKDAIPEFWKEVTSDEQFRPLYKSMDSLGVVGVSYNFTDKDSDYLIGVHSKEGDVIFEAGTYAFFIMKGKLPGAVRERELEAIQEIEKSGYEFDGVMLEVYPEGNPSSEDYITEVYFKIKVA